jgi:hypothetical protein
MDLTKFLMRGLALCTASIAMQQIKEKATTVADDEGGVAPIAADFALLTHALTYALCP